MLSWLFGKKPAVEKSPGGSTIQRYEKCRGPRIGFAGESTARFAEAREEVYQRFFGTAVNISHEVLPLIPHIDVHVYSRELSGRGCSTLVTSGMGDVEMRLPARAKDAPKRVELILYCSEPRQEYIDTMRWLAHFPHDNKTWLSFGHTVPNGNPPAPFWGSSVLDTILLLPTVVKRDATLPQELKLAGEPVHFLWVVPLTTAECELKLSKGLDAILELFEQHRHPPVFDPNRTSYV
jgi:hypothetical protein